MVTTRDEHRHDYDDGPWWLLECGHYGRFRRTQPQEDVPSSVHCRPCTRADGRPGVCVHQRTVKRA